METKSRELFASRIGFILMSAGCAIGLGNVWRFPYIVGKYGGGLFVLLYLFFLIVLGYPCLLMELSLGRAGRSTYPGAFRNLQDPAIRFRWAGFGHVLFSGNLLLLMFYTAVTGWLMAYAVRFLRGDFMKLDVAGCQQAFGTFLDSPGEQTFYMLLALVITVVICIGGVRKTIEKSIKLMMVGLFLLLMFLVIRSLCLPDAWDGVVFFLKPSVEAISENGFAQTLHAAMAQAFFTLSIGIGSIAVCGSYMNRDRSLPQEGLWILVLDTFMAICSGLIIFPGCASFGISPGAGPALIFVTLPNVFRDMSGGLFWGTLFFVFLSIAALSTLIAVFENLVAFGMDEFKLSRKRSCGIAGVLLAVLSMPCILGFNLWRSFQPLGKGSNILDLEDFLVSDNLLPLGALYLTIFCTNRIGWGMDPFYTEVNAGNGWHLPRMIQPYLRWGLPVVILLIWITGLAKRFLL